MAISPEEVKRNKQAKLDALEAFIDKELSKESLWPDSTIRIYIEPGMWNKSHWNEIEHRYIQAGWDSKKIKYIEGDQRDPGDTIIFTV